MFLKKEYINDNIKRWKRIRDKNLNEKNKESLLKLDDIIDDSWRKIDGKFTVIGCMTYNPEGEYCHASDGNLDIKLCKYGNIGENINMGLRYVQGDVLKSSLVEYFKVKKMALETQTPVVNCDGEILPLTSLTLFEVLPGFVNTFGEY